MPDYDEVVRRARDMQLREPGDRRWGEALRALLPTPDAVAGFVRWASAHPKWRFNVADVTDGACAKPREAAIVILSDIVAECLDEAPT